MDVSSLMHKKGAKGRCVSKCRRTKKKGGGKRSLTSCRRKCHVKAK